MIYRQNLLQLACESLNVTCGVLFVSGNFLLELFKANPIAFKDLKDCRLGALGDNFGI